MIKRITLVGSILAVAGLSFLNSCKDDEETPITGIQFELEEQEVTESDGTLQSLHPEIEGLDEPGVGRTITVNLVFDRALAGDIVLQFDLDGTARETSSATELSDFAISEEGENLTVDNDEITILKGTQAASFNIVIYEDLRFEYDDEGDFNDDDVPYETIELTLESVVSGPAKLGTELEHSIKILEDDAVGVLTWEAQDFENQTEAEVDMDMILWFEEVSWTAGAQEGTDIEVFPIPAGLGEGNVGVSYTYYSGNSDDLDFESGFFNTAGELEGTRYTYPIDDPLIFSGNYKLVNKNEYNESSPPKIAQTITKSGINYSDFSALSPFETGSRVPTRLDRTILKRMAIQSKQIRSLKSNLRN